MELEDLFKRPDIVNETKSKHLEWAGHGGKKTQWSTNPRGKRPLWKSIIRWEDRVKKNFANFSELEHKNLHWREVAEDQEKWRMVRLKG